MLNDLCDFATFLIKVAKPFHFLDIPVFSYTWTGLFWLEKILLVHIFRIVNLSCDLFTDFLQ